MSLVQKPAICGKAARVNLLILSIVTIIAHFSFQEAYEQVAEQAEVDDQKDV